MRFVQLHHELPKLPDRSSHYDLMLQDGDCLLTWELPVVALQTDDQCQARRLPNHRLEYLDFSGPISGGRGVVRPVSAGELCWQPNSGDRPEMRLAIVKCRDSSRWEIELVEISEMTWVVSWRRLG